MMPPISNHPSITPTPLGDGARGPADVVPQMSLRELTNKEFRGAHRSFLARSEAVWGVALERNPSLHEKIESFKSRYGENIRAIESQGWKELKLGRGIGMARPFGTEPISMEEFRDEANKLITELTITAAQEMGLPEVDWKASGTAGYNSDVDVAIVPKGELLTYDAYMLKFLRETCHTFVFGGLSGTQIDTESYTPHTAQNHTLDQLLTEQSHGKFAASEMSMAFMQGKLGSLHSPAHWSAFCESELQHTDPDRRSSVREMMVQVDRWQDSMQLDILKQVIFEDILKNQGIQGQEIEIIWSQINKFTPEAIREQSAKIMEKDPDSFKRASSNYKVPVMLRIAERCSEIQVLLKAANINTKVRDFSDSLRLELDVLTKILYSCQDEATFTEGEGNVTLFLKGGQIDQRRTEDYSRQIKEQAIQREAKPVAKMMHPAILARELSQIRESLNVPGERDPSVADLCAAASEEQQQFNHIIDQGLTKAKKSESEGASDKIAGETAINGGKYCLRTIRSKLRAMEKFEFEEEIPPEKQEAFDALKLKMKKMEAKALYLEQCKRKFVLNKAATISMLVEKFLIVPKQRAAFTEQVGTLLDEIKPYGKHIHELKTKRENLNFLLTNFQKMKLVGEVQVNQSPRQMFGPKLAATDPELQSILKAHVGYSRTKEKHRDLVPVFTEGDRRTLTELGLTTLEGVSAFASDVQQVQWEWQNLAFDIGALPPLAEREWIATHLNFSDIWEQAK